MKHILHSSLLWSFPEIVQWTSTKDFWPLSFTYEKHTNQVIIDRVRFLDTLWLDASGSVLVCEQNHTANIIHITDDHIGHGLLDSSKQIWNADGMITHLRNIHLIVYTADCMPVSFYDPVRWVIGIVHSGWRGTIGGISRKMIGLFQELYGSDTKDIRVSIWPSIGPCCYEVRNPEQLELFHTRYNAVEDRGWLQYVDLWKSIEKDMLELGIERSHLENLHTCTACQNKYYASHRKDNPNTTTNLTVISRK